MHFNDNFFFFVYSIYKQCARKKLTTGFPFLFFNIKNAKNTYYLYLSGY